VNITALDDESVTLDANHPLAGHTLLFDVELMEIAQFAFSCKILVKECHIILRNKKAPIIADWAFFKLAPRVQPFLQAFSTCWRCKAPEMRPVIYSLVRFLISRPYPLSGDQLVAEPPGPASG